ncbi:MAG TPA: hypothetical protein VFN55_00515 [Solirubrobacteraceae bacterium]|nr:hypothetical protein [Solirubrobacteraceae bacterium]
MNDDTELETPPAVIGSISAGVGPLPFLAIYAVLFLIHGFVYPVQPPDITGSQAGEGIAGIIALVLFGGCVLTIWWFLNGRRRWPFVVAQLATLITAIDFIANATTGSPAVPFVLVLTSLVALALAFAPSAWRHVGQAPWRGRGRPDSGAVDPLTPSSRPDEPDLFGQLAGDPIDPGPDPGPGAAALRHDAAD